MKKTIQSILILSGIITYSQTFLNTPITESNKVITDPSAIEMLPGFKVSAATIGNFRAYISSVTVGGGGTTTPVPPSTSGLSTNENYIQKITYLQPVTSSNSSVRQIRTVEYFDGLGRPKQVVNVKASPLGRDVVTHIEYDAFGREVKNYLPVPQASTENGALFPEPLSNAIHTPYGTEKIYSEKTLENSPLDRIQQQIQVGSDWSQKPVKFEYSANTTADAVKKYKITTAWSNGATSSTLGTASSTYGINQLYKNTITDEDGNKTIEFKNGKGQVILVRKVLNATKNADTYYVYNEYDQLAFVVPPEASIVANVNTVLGNLVYIYRYDGRGRLVEKKIPGKGWEYMVYDKQDRLILSQDAILKEKGQWLFTKYDQFSRVIYTGILNSSPGRPQQVAAVEGKGSNNEKRSSSSWASSGMSIYYTNNTAYPTTNFQISSVNYYDTYPEGTPAIPTQILGQAVLSQNAQGSNTSTKSLPVASYIKNIEDDSWTKNYTWYDIKGREIGSHSVNYLGGYTKTESLLDFAGVTQKNITKHERLTSDTERVITEVFTYDHQNRLKKHTHQVNGKPVEVLAENQYNELSQLSTKKVGNNIQSIDYSYNIRGWMTRVNDVSNLNGKLFGYEIRYNNPVYTNIAPGRYNGNIAEVDWKTSNDHVLRRYSYSYDGLNRLSFGHYSEPGITTPQENYFGEYLEYDLNGNITLLTRNAKNPNGQAMQIDKLKYFYTGNRLDRIIDDSYNLSGYPGGGNTITYDVNGNMKNHKDKKISSIVYNYLNLPQQITQNGIISNYLYRADGVKLRKRYGDKETTYLDGFQYTNNVLNFIPTSEGYYNFENNKYIYNYVDHLGNVRLSYTKKGSGTEIIEESNYYPFGLKHEGYNGLAGNTNYQYQYNGKELQETGMYDYGARMYMPDLGRWGVVDPLAEVSKRWTPYNYAYNNPIMFVDPDGMLSVSSLQEMWDNTSGSSTWTNSGNGTFDGGEDDPKKKNDRKAGSKPTGMSEKASLSQLVTIGGKKYHKNTGNLGAQIGNKINAFFGGDDDYFVEHKEYNSADDRFIHEAVNTSAGALVGGVVGKVAGKGFGMLFSKSKAFNPTSFADEIVSINAGTEGGGVLLNGSPSSAINSAMYYDTAAEQGASIFRSISHGHMFVDGNKRTAVQAFMYFAKQNGLKTVPVQQIYNIANKVATGQITEVSQISKMLVK